jgi:2-dehydro-3-deoxyphosphogluconate aldolase/(4S)-4-hydroxy-2-oxoglutarate aldolase
MKAIALNLKIVKFFPANVYGGIKAIKSLAAPFKQVKFLPTGGVDENNIDEYLSCDKVCAVGATYIMKGDIVANCKKISHLLGD